MIDAKLVERLKKEGNFKEAIEVLKVNQEREEAYALKHGFNTSIYIYEQLAICHRKLKNYHAEVEVLERYMQISTGKVSDKLFKRLVKAYELTEKIQKVDGIILHKEKNLDINELPCFEMIGACVDTETTGGTFSDELIEIGIVLFKFNRKTGQLLEIIEEYNGLREPNVPMNYFAQRVHGISLESLRGLKLEEEKIKTMLESSQAIIAHNASFDHRFVSNLFPTVKWSKWYCSVKNVDWRGKGFKSRKLQELLPAHGISVERAHRALDDAKGLFNLITNNHNAKEAYILEILRGQNFTPKEYAPVYTTGNTFSRF